MDPVNLIKPQSSILVNNREQMFYYNFTAYAVALLSLFSGIWTLFQNNFQLSLFLISIFLLIFLNLTIFPPDKKFKTSSAILIIIIVIADLYLFRITESLPYVWIFILFFPFISLMLKGPKTGGLIALTLAVLLILSEIMPLPYNPADRGLVFNIAFFSLYLIVLCVLYIIFEINYRSIKEQTLKSGMTSKELQEKNEFITSLSHQLRTSLSNIMLVNNLVYNSGLNNVQKELLDTLKASTNNLIEAVNKIVDISQPDLDKIKINIISFNLFHALDSIKMLYSGRKDLTLTINPSPNIQNYLIGDPIKIKQIFLNLVQNILYSGSDSLNQIIEINVIPEKETKSDIEIEFIAETCFKNIEGKSIILPELDSLHLTNTKKLIEHSGGSLSIIHKGALTIFGFILSFKKDPYKKITEDTEKTAQEEKKSIKLKDAIILLVEDNLINQKIVTLSLKNMVKNIDVANNGKEALDKFASSKYDLILMDVQMPVMDGIVAAKKIRELEVNTNSQIPIIAITANALSGDREHCLAVGMNDYISKPYQIDILFQKMRVLIEKRIE